MKLFVAVLFLIGTAHMANAAPIFILCDQGTKTDCVVDGDTIYWQGQSLRLIDIDAPEIFSPHCAFEYDLGIKARDRLLELLNASVVTLEILGRRDHDVYGRKLRLVMVDGESVGTLLIGEDLASRWQGRHHRWCPQ